MFTYYIYTDHSMSMMVCQISPCVYMYTPKTSKTIKLCQMPMLIIIILKKKMCTELKVVRQYLSSTSFLSQFTVRQLLAIFQFYCVKKHIIFFNMIGSINRPTHIELKC